MNQSQLIDAIAQQADVPKTTAKRMLDGLTNCVHAAVKMKGDITVLGIGKFSTKNMAGRKGRNPHTGEEIDIPSRIKPHFSAAKALKDAAATGH